MVGLCWLACACEQFSSSYQYLGERRLSDKPLVVRTVFWPAAGALAFAVERVSEGPPLMHLVPVSGEKACRAGPVSRFAAITTEEGAFHLALLDEAAHRVRFYSAGCESWEPDVDGVERLNLRTGRDGHRFMLRTEDRRLLAAEPISQRLTVLAKDVERVGSGVLRPEGRDALWVQTDDQLVMVDGLGEKVGPVLEGITGFDNYQGVGFDGETHAYLLVQRGRVMTLVDMTGPAFDDEPDEISEVWSSEDSCGEVESQDSDEADMQASASGERMRPRIQVVRGVCVGEDCDDAAAGARGPTAWSSFFSPCDEKRLVLRSDRPDQEPIPIAEGVKRYRVLEAGVDGLPVVVYRLSADESDTDFLQLAGQEPIPLGVRADLDSIEVLAETPLLSFVTDEKLPSTRFVMWEPEGGVEEVLSGVAQLSSSGLVLHDFDPDRRLGKLSFCSRRRCTALAEDVPRQGYRSYEAVERIGEPIPMFAFLQEVDPDAGVGVLRVMDRTTGKVVDVARDVSNFAPVELGGARGMVYTVPEGKRRGLWYAPR